MNEDYNKEYFREGCHAYRDGSKCPYPMGTSAANHWALGYASEKSWQESELARELKGTGQ